MAIQFNCPHCQYAYRLKDELAGKTASCKQCRTKIVIPLAVSVGSSGSTTPAPQTPKPVSKPTPKPASKQVPPSPISQDNTPLPRKASEAELAEAAALAAFADEPAKVEQQGEKLIPVECKFCEHKWTVPFAKAGKNVLCANPECRRQTKVPEPKEDVPQDWRQQKTKLPSLAKEHAEKLEGVQDAGDVKHVGGAALREAGVLDDDIEPRPLKQKVMFVVIPLVLLAGTTLGIRSCYVGRTEDRQHKLIEESQTEFAAELGRIPLKEALPDLQIASAFLYISGGEHAMRHDEPKLKESMDQFSKARDAIRTSPQGFVRYVVAGELAVAILVLGGSEQDARDQKRIRWLPEANSKVRPNERVFTVLETLRQTLSLVQDADFEFKSHLARRLTRELTKRGQALLAVELLPLALFTQAEQDEAKAIIALEVKRADAGSDLPRKVADDLKSRGAELFKGMPFPASGLALFAVVNIEKAPTLVAAPTNNPVQDVPRYAYTCRLLMEQKFGEALTLATRPGAPEGQVRALTLSADWSDDPTAALDAALAIISANKSRKDFRISPYAVLRLSQIAAEKGKHEQAASFANLIADEGLRAWAKGDAVRLRFATAPTEKAETAIAELPDDMKKLRAGHVWARMWVARHNTRISGDRSGEVKALKDWPPLVAPFGKAGIALGLQDK